MSDDGGDLFSAKGLYGHSQNSFDPPRFWICSAWVAVIFGVLFQRWYLNYQRRMLQEGVLKMEITTCSANPLEVTDVDVTEQERTRKQKFDAQKLLNRASIEMNKKQQLSKSAHSRMNPTSKLSMMKGAVEKVVDAQSVFKGFRPQNEEEARELDDQAASMFKSAFTKGWFLAMGSPFMTLRELGRRLSPRNVADWRNLWGGSIVLPYLVLCIIATLVCLLATDLKPSRVGAAICLCMWFTLLLGTMIIWMSQTDQDMEWTEIDDFLEHRHVRRSNQNYLALATQAMTFFQFLGLTFNVVYIPLVQITSYQQFKSTCTSVFKIGIFDFGIKWFDVSFGLAVGLVVLWYLLFGGLGYQLMSVVASDGAACERRNVILRSKLYQRMEAIHGSGAFEMLSMENVFTLLSDTLFLTIVSSLLRMLDCTYETVAADSCDSASAAEALKLHAQHPYLTARPEWVCWQGQHLYLSAVAALCLVYYVPTALLQAPFIISDSDGLFISEDLDLRFTSRFLVAERCGKLLIAASSIFLGCTYAWAVLLLQFTVLSFLGYYMQTKKPCSILWVNSLRSSIFTGCAMASLCILFELNTGVEWVPMILMLVSFMLAILWVVHNYVKLRNLGWAPHITRTARIGYVLEGGSKLFDDTGLLRGFSHRLNAITIMSNQEAVTAIRCQYEVDGTIVDASSHLGKLADEETDTCTTITFEPGSSLSEVEVNLLPLELLDAVKDIPRGETMFNGQDQRVLRLQQLVDEVRRGERHLVGDGRVVGYLRLRKLCANGTYDTEPNSGKTPYTFGMDPDEMMLNSPHRQFVRATDGQMIVGMHGAMSNYMDAFGIVQQSVPGYSVPFQALNEDGNPVRMGSKRSPNDYYNGVHNFYCGLYAPAKLHGSDGNCGPTNGPSCPACVKFVPKNSNGDVVTMGEDVNYESIQRDSELEGSESAWFFCGKALHGKGHGHPGCAQGSEQCEACKTFQEAVAFTGDKVEREYSSYGGW